MNGYKVIHSFDEELVSFSVDVGMGGIRYIPGHKVEPCENCGPLCVFTEYKTAVSYLFNFSIPPIDKIWICNYKPSEESEVWAFDSAIISIDSMPPHTALADWVRLIKPLKCSKGEQMELIPVN